MHCWIPCLGIPKVLLQQEAQVVLPAPSSHGKDCCFSCNWHLPFHPSPPGAKLSLCCLLSKDSAKACCRPQLSLSVPLPSVCLHFCLYASFLLPLSKQAAPTRSATPLVFLSSWACRSLLLNPLVLLSPSGLQALGLPQPLGLQALGLPQPIGQLLI